MVAQKIEEEEQKRQEEEMEKNEKKKLSYKENMFTSFRLL